MKGLEIIVNCGHICLEDGVVEHHSSCFLEGYYMKIRMMVIVMLLVVALGTMVVMSATAATATRTSPYDCIEPGANFTVAITADDYGCMGAVTETLCADWEYVGVTGAVDDVQIEGNDIKFLLMGNGPRTFNYTVSAPGEGGACYPISGTLRDEDKQDHTVTGATEVCVCGDPDDLISATRDISNQRVEPGSTFTVVLELTTNVDVPAPGLKENRPAGWGVTAVDNGGAPYKAATTEWVWTAAMSSGDFKTVTYDVTVPTDAASQDYHIAGHVSAYGVDPIKIGGESRVTVVTLCGDVNHDELLSTTDVMLALQMAANKTDIDFAADVNADGAVTAIDALLIWQSLLS